jgi:hypothetical protein
MDTVLAAFVHASRVGSALVSSATLIVLLAGGGCFKPNIKEGGFRCADGGVCPEGFVCDTGGTNTCWTKLPDAGVGGKGGGAGGGGSGVGGAGGEPPCFEAKTDCDPADGGVDAGLCDPFCQTGCSGCREKCSVNNQSALTCNQVTSNNLKGLLEACTVSSGGTAAQSDNCAPGLVCLDGCGGTRCYQFCQKDQDCPNAACDRPVGTNGQKVCDVPFVDCNPFGATAGCSGFSTVACYLSSTHPDKTVCDCPFKAGAPNEACDRSRDCNRGLACAYYAGSRKCLKVCVTDNDCDVGVTGSCHAYLGASGAGPANATYGFCY